LSSDTVEKRFNELLEYFKDFDSIVIAFSGGVDSSVLAAAAHRMLSGRCLAATVISELSPRSEIKMAREVASFLDVPHAEIELAILNNSGVRENEPNRCYQCKSIIMREIKGLASCRGLDFVADGSNYDDLSDYRPGFKAASELNIKHPFIELRINKQEIKDIAHWLKLPNADAPSMACLASRIAYGLSLDKSILERIDAGEDFIREQGFRVVRLRYHGDLVRIELAEDDIISILQPEIKEKLIHKMKLIGFKYVTIDIEGYSTGSMNRSLESD
jgi:uncharacterized protein